MLVLFFLVCSHPLVEKSVLLALETRLGGNFVGSEQNFPKLFSWKRFLLSEFWLHIYYMCFQSQNYNSTSVWAHAVSYNKSDGFWLQCSHCNMFSFIFFIRSSMFHYFDLLSFANLLELLVINHSSFGRRNIFVSRWLKLSPVLVALQLEWVRTSPQLRWITRSGLALCLAL